MTDAASKLRESGFTRDQVEALIEVMGSGAATKIDIQRLEGKLKSDIVEANAKVKADIQRLELKLKADIQRLEGILNLHSWMAGLIIAGVAGLIIKAFFT